MISLPQNDLRHTGHVGFDGAAFGDLAFIGDSYDQLPIKVVAPCESDARDARRMTHTTCMTCTIRATRRTHSTQHV